MITILNFDKNKKYTTIAIYSFIVSALIVLLVFVIMNLGLFRNILGTFLSIISPLIYGFIFAYLCNPIFKFTYDKLFKFIEKKKSRPKLRRAFSMILTYTLVLTFITVFILLVIPQVVYSYNDLQSQVTGYISGVQKWADSFVRDFPLFNGAFNDLSELLNVTDLNSYVTDFLMNSYNLLTTVVNYVILYAGRFAIELKNILLGIILSVYFLMSKDKLVAQIKKTMLAFMSTKHYTSTIGLAKFTHETFGGFIMGKLLDSLIIGLLTFVVLGIFKMPYYPLLSVIIGVTNVIPFFGPFIGAIPSAFIILSASPQQTIIFVIIIIIIQQLDGNVIGPKILGESTGLSALWVVIAITIMGGVFGVMGMFIGVPTFAVLYVLVKQFVENRLKKRELPVETSLYYSDELINSSPQGDSSQISALNDSEQSDRDKKE